MAYLTDPTTVYPVTIDPTITSKDTMSTSNIEDATVFSGYPNNNFGNYVFNTIGYQDASYGTGRVAVRLKGLLNDATYQSLSADHIVSVQFYMKDGGSNYAYVNIHALTGNATWTESTVKNSNVGTASQTVYDSQRMGGGKWATFDLTDLAKDWKNGNQNGQCGFLMVIADSTKKIGALSCEYGSGDYWPYVVVNYAVSSVLNYTVKDINEGSSFVLTADTGGVAAEITWTSSNTGVATVSSSGVVTGVNAGKAVITVSSDVFTEPVSCVVYVAIPDGVYYIKNASSGLCLQGAVSSIQTFEQKTGSENRLNQLWKIRYLGSGYYVIRPMMDFAAALTTNNQGYAAVAAAAVEDDEVATGSRWTIIHNSFGYAFKRSESDTKALTPVVSGCPGSAVYLGTWDASLTRHWELESAKGVFLRDTATLKLLTSTSTRYILLGESATLSELGIRDEVSGGITGISWDPDNNENDDLVSDSGTVTGVECGAFVITATGMIGDTEYSQSYKLCVMLIPEGTYFIRSKSSGKYADIKNQAMADGTTIHQWDFHGGNTQRWIFTYQPDGTYTIHSANSETKYYLGVSGDSAANNRPVVLRTSGTGSGAKWKISRTTSGAYKLTPLTGEANNRVLALDVGVFGNATANGDTLQQRDYVDDTNYKDEWLFYQANLNSDDLEEIHIVNLAVMYDRAYLNRFPDAAERIATQVGILQEKFLDEFGILVNLTVPMPFSSYADYCTTDPNVRCTHCTDEECTDYSNLHHNNITNILSRLPTQSCENDLKMAYIGHVTCAESGNPNNPHSLNPHLGLAYSNLLGVMCYVTVTDETQVMIHEFGHFFGVIDHYGCNAKGTAEIINETGNDGYSEYCIYGERNSDPTVQAEFVICDGCKSLIEANASKFDQN